MTYKLDFLMLTFISTAEVPENDGGELLLSKEFLRSSMDSFSVPPRPGENSPRAFMPKHLNIVDPLKENNNLGRSVSKGFNPLLRFL